MTTESIDQLNSRFAVPGHARIVAGPGGLPMIEVNNAAAAASVLLYGAHVATFQPHGGKPLLWLSPKAIFSPGKPIRGGIPVCWPNFSTPPAGSALAFHGFARIRSWQLVRVTPVAADCTELCLRLEDDAETRALWPFPFLLELVVKVGRCLDVELVIHNSGSTAFTCTCALHTYLAVSDIATVTVAGLDGTEYLDTLTAPPSVQQQRGDVTFAGNVDRVYRDTIATCHVGDPDWERTLTVSKRGSHATVVWNPWDVKAAAMADLGVEHWRGLLCIEAVNTGADSITVPPGGTHRLATGISANIG